MTESGSLQGTLAAKRKKRPSILAGGAFFFTGIFTVLSVPLIGDNTQTVRFLDFFGLAGLIYLFRILLLKKISPRIWVMCWIACLGLTLVFVDTMDDGDTGRFNIVARIILSTSAGITLALLAVERSGVKTLALGIWLGAVLGCVLAYGQSLGIGVLLELAPADRVESAIQGEIRNSAIWGHPNAAAQTTMAGAAIILLAWTRRNSIVMLPVLMYLIVSILNYVIMQNRGPLVVGLLFASFFALKYSQLNMRIMTFICAAGLISIVVVDPASFIGDRWTGTFSGLSTEEQALERLRSTFSGLSIAFEAPLGHSLAEREARMLTETGIRASHNGFVFAALVLGPWISASFFGLLATIFALGPRSGDGRYYGLALGSLCTMLLFEDAIFEPTVTTLLVFIVSLKYVETMASQNKLFRDLHSAAH